MSEPASIPYPLRVWLWIAGALLLQTVTALPTLIFITLGTVAGAAWFDRGRLLRLLRRIRWIVVSIVLLFGWLTPGTAILPIAVPLMPTYEGLTLALEHGLRLVALVAWLVFWFLWLPIAEQPRALYRAFTPLVWLGVPLDRFAVRLALILDLLDEIAARPIRLRDWRQLPQWLEEGEAASSQPTDPSPNPQAETNR